MMVLPCQPVLFFLLTSVSLIGDGSDNQNGREDEQEYVLEMLSCLSFFLCLTRVTIITLKRCGLVDFSCTECVMRCIIGICIEWGELGDGIGNSALTIDRE